MSSTESIATPAIPTSPSTLGLSESYLNMTMKNECQTFLVIIQKLILYWCNLPDNSPPMCGQIKGHTESLLSCSDILSVKLVTFFHCTKSSILKNYIIRNYYFTRHFSLINPGLINSWRQIQHTKKST